jgi:hypothetical protein
MAPRPLLVSETMAYGSRLTMAWPVNRFVSGPNVMHVDSLRRVEFGARSTAQELVPGWVIVVTRSIS